MQLEKQVCSLELSKRLKELGAKQESVFSWHETNNGFMLTQEREAWMDNPVSAFTVAELGEILPQEVEEDEQSYWFICEKGLMDEWIVGYRKNGASGIWYAHNADTEADARAEMLIYLLENKLISNE